MWGLAYPRFQGSTGVLERVSAPGDQEETAKWGKGLPHEADLNLIQLRSVNKNNF